MEGFFISAIFLFPLKPFIVQHFPFYLSRWNQTWHYRVTKNQEMKNCKSFIESHVKPWHLLAGMYGFIIVAGITYRILNA